MARFNMSEADNYGGNGGGQFFSLKDDKDTARVRFLYKTIDDLEGYAVHRVTVGDKERWVNCLREYNEPVENCPFCAAQMRVTPKLFLKLYNVDDKECQIWERGKKYFERVSGLASRYNPLCNRIVEIERNGKKGDKQTDYAMYPLEDEPVNINDFEPIEPLGTVILDKTADEMNTYLDTGSFPDTASSVSEQRSSQRENLSQPTGRRTPENTGRRAF